MTQFEPQQFGKYYLTEKLAVGGMAEIYKAKTFGAEGFEKLLAIKKILPHAAEDKEFIHMLIDEAKLSVLLSHANIVQVYDLGKVGNDYFISMEYIHGVNLRDVLYLLREKNKKMPAELAVYISSEVCKGLDYAHRKTDANNQPLGIVHRDISPQNILISFEGEVKIVDFGIAKAAMNISHTMAGILKGKIAYMSPEQAMGKTIDARTDIFSLGIILFEALTGQKLYTGESQFEVLKKIRTTRVQASKLPESIPTALRTVLSKALAYNLEDRFTAAGDFQIALTKYLYATYTDFAPRKLSTFVKELFHEHLTQEKDRPEVEKLMSAKTSSMSFLTIKPQETLVHRQTASSQTGQKSKVDETHPMAGIQSVSISGTEETTPKPKRLLRRLFLSLGVFAVVGFLFWKYYPSKKPFSTPTTTGTVYVQSEPSGAAIHLDRKPTPFKTPAVLDHLTLNKNYLLGLTLDQFGRHEETFLLKNTDLLTLNIQLSKNLGFLNITSEPPGAMILVNGIEMGQTTPAEIKDLVLNTEYRITLKKSGFEPTEQPITLVSPTPQKLHATLKSIQELIKGSLVVETTPAGAKIFINDQDTGKTTPTKLEDLNVGEKFSLRIEKEGFKSKTKTITLVDAKPFSINETLFPASSTPQEAFSALSIKTEPSGAQIILDGKDTGQTTPMTFEQLPFGSHTVRLLKKGFQPVTRRIQVASEKPYSIETTLKEESVTTPKPKPIERPTTPESPTETEQAPRGGIGTLQIRSNPSGADVFIEGDHKGTTPLTLKTGSGTVKVLVSKGSELLPCRKVIQLRPDQTQTVDCTLGELYGEINIVSRPARANVYLNGQPVNGKTPLTIKKVKRDRDHILKLELEGFQPWTRSFNLQDSMSKSFDVELEK